MIVVARGADKVASLGSYGHEVAQFSQRMAGLPQRLEGLVRLAAEPLQHILVLELLVLGFLLLKRRSMFMRLLLKLPFFR